MLVDAEPIINRAHEAAAHAGTTRQDALRALQGLRRATRREGVSPRCDPAPAQIDSWRIFRQPRRANVCPLQAALDPSLGTGSPPPLPPLRELRRKLSSGDEDTARQYLLSAGVK